MSTIHWRIHSTEPTIGLGRIHGTLDVKRAGAAHVVQRGDKYLMTYWGTDADGKNHVLGAEARVDRPNDWTTLGAFIGPQNGNEFNSTGPSFPFLLPVDANYWLLYFCGWGHRPDGKLPNTTGVAISEDAGKTWRYHSHHPVFEMDRDFDRDGTGSLWVTHEDGRFRAWYTSIGYYSRKPAHVQTGHGETIPYIGIGYAESDDGLNWRKPLGTWVIKHRMFAVEPYEYIVSKPSLLIDEIDGRRHYTMWVNTFGTAYRVHRLHSWDGINWRWAPRVGPEGELPPAGVEGRFDSHQRSYPVVVRHGDELRCWFTGNGFGTHGMGYATAHMPARALAGM
jgi:hypothetical protein